MSSTKECLVVQRVKGVVQNYAKSNGCTDKLHIEVEAAKDERDMFGRMAHNRIRVIVMYNSTAICSMVCSSDDVDDEMVDYMMEDLDLEGALSNACPKLKKLYDSRQFVRKMVELVPVNVNEYYSEIEGLAFTFDSILGKTAIGFENEGTGKHVLLDKELVESILFTNGKFDMDKFKSYLLNEACTVPIMVEEYLGSYVDLSRLNGDEENDYEVYDEAAYNCGTVMPELHKLERNGEIRVAVMNSDQLKVLFMPDKLRCLKMYFDCDELSLVCFDTSIYCIEDLNGRSEEELEELLMGAVYDGEEESDNGEEEVFYCRYSLKEGKIISITGNVVWDYEE